MPFALLIIGVVLIVAGVRNTQSQLFSLVQGDFTGRNNFVFWFASILIVGAIGYIKPLKPISTAFLTLLVLVLFLKKGNPSGLGGGFFQQFSQALGTTGSAATNTVLSPSPSGVASSTASATSSGQSPVSQLPAIQAQISNLQSQLAQNLEQTEQGLLQDFSQTPQTGVTP